MLTLAHITSNYCGFSSFNLGFGTIVYLEIGYSDISLERFRNVCGQNFIALNKIKYLSILYLVFYRMKN